MATWEVAELCWPCWLSSADNTVSGNSSHGWDPWDPWDPALATGPYRTRSMGDFSRQSRHQRGPFMMLFRTDLRSRLAQGLQVLQSHVLFILQGSFMRPSTSGDFKSCFLPMLNTTASLSWYCKRTPLPTNGYVGVVPPANHHQFLWFHSIPAKKNPNCLAGWPQVRCNNFGYLNDINQWYDGIISFIQ